MPYINSYAFGSGGRVLYWVGGTATWNSTVGTKWALTSGGAGGEPVPTSVDDVYFDGNSGSGTVTLSGTAICRSVSFWGYAGTLSHPTSTTWTIYGALILYPLMTYSIAATRTAKIVYAATANNWYIYSSIHTMPEQDFNGVGGEWTLYDDTINGHVSQFGLNLINGLLNTNGVDVTAVNFDGSNSNVRSLTLGNSIISVSQAAGFTAWDLATTTNLTFDAGTSTINLTGNGVTEFFGGGLTYNAVTIQPSATVPCSITGANTFANFTATSPANVRGTILLSNNQTVTDTISLDGNSPSFRLFVASDVFSTPRTITAANVSVTSCDFRDITGAGAGSWNLSSITGRSGDALGNSGITFSSPRTIFWFEDSGAYTSTTQWFTGIGGTGDLVTCPIPQDTGRFNNNSFSGINKTITATAGSKLLNNALLTQRIGTLDFTGSTNNPEFISNGINCYGSLTLISGMTHTGGVGDLWEWLSRDAQTFTSGGLTWPSSYQMQLYGDGTGTITQQDSFRTADELFITNGAWITGNNTLRAQFLTVNGDGSLTTGTGLLTSDNYLSLVEGDLTVGGGGVSATDFRSTGSLTRALNMGSGTWTLSGTGTVWNMASTGLTLASETSTISVTDTSSTAKTFEGLGQTYYNLLVNGAASAGTLTIENSSTFNNVTFAANSNIRLTAATTQTINGTITATGTAGNGIVVNSTSATNATISSVNSVNWDYVTLTDLTGIGGGTFTATNSVDGGGNINWNIT